MSVLTDQLDAVRLHLGAFALPEPCHVAVDCATPLVTMQLDRITLDQIAAALVAWADTLTRVTAEAWRVPDGHSVHLSITGRMPGGARVRVYDAVAYDPTVPGLDLAATEHRPLILAELRAFAGRAGGEAA
jgi:hypothetical protein